MTNQWIVLMVVATLPMWLASANAQTVKPPAAPATSAVDPAKAAEHAEEDIKRHRTMAAAHEAAAKCQEAGTKEDVCMAQLARACKGIAIGKYCGMKHQH